MMLTTTEPSACFPPDFLIKVCGITAESDARAALEAGANALGFNFYAPSPRNVAPLRASEIIAAIPGLYRKVGVFVNPSLDELLSTLHTVPLDVIQLHGARCPPAISASLPKSIRIWRATTVDALPAESSDTEAFLLDSPTPEYGGSGQTFDWSAALPFTRALHRPFLLAGGLDSNNVAAGIATLEPWGVDACSRLESRPGSKDTTLVRAFVSAALAAFRHLPQESLL